MKKIVLWILILNVTNIVAVENIHKSKINQDLLEKHWSAYWIANPDDSGLEFGVYHFRKSFELNAVPKEFIIHISADNRYQLFVNGERVCFGPSRGDLMNWKYESIDISAFLKKGKNTLAAVVWNFADKKPWAQHSLQTGFILQGNNETEEIVNTDNTWKVIKNSAYSPGKRSELGTFIIVGPEEEINGDLYPWGWEDTGYDDSEWASAHQIERGKPKVAGTGINWGLEPGDIPLMEAYQQRFVSVKRSENVDSSKDFIDGKNTLTIQPRQKIKLLLDQGKLTMAYPELLVSGGKGAKIVLTYAEALFDKNGNKGNRNEIEGKEIKGYRDLFFPDGGKSRLFRPLWFRTWRYLQVEIETGVYPLILENFQSEFTAYPFKENASFKSDDKQLTEIWNVGWHTARLCAGETYYDCPYYEQMQYVGDTRIQALISLYVSGDDRLMRKAIQVFDDSRFSEGLTMSRYPSSTPQVIPTYSLFWIDMVHDYWMHREDDRFVKSFLNGIDNVLNFFTSKIDSETGLIGVTGYWHFVDWAKEWPWDNHLKIGGVPKGGSNDGNSSIISFQYVYSARHAADLHRWAGNENKAEVYEKLADKMMQAIKKHCWDSSNQYFSNTPEKTEYSMHAQIFAVLTGAVADNEIKDFVLRFEQDDTLIQPTMYFRFYLKQALKKAGLADNYLQTLALWREMLDLGLTTFAEKPDPTRSDCHAWSASPNYDFLATVVGIEPASPGFKTVKIEPHLGELEMVQGKMPHPKGIISFDLKRTGEKGITGQINLPENLAGEFWWKKKRIKLEGQTKIDL